jgi:dTDP-4-dehydrorhamnose 3,5-epimerase
MVGKHRRAQAWNTWDYFSPMPFRFDRDVAVPDVIRIEPVAISDERGWFAEIYREREFAAVGIHGPFRQTDHSLSSRAHVLRGLHYQLRSAAQGKLVRCTRGRIFDVALDIRRGSPTYGRSVGVTLDSAAPSLLWIPAGFAHGFLTLTDESEIIYQHTAEFDPARRRRIRWNDPELAIPWPIGDAQPILTADDARAPLLRDAENDFAWVLG